MFKVECLGCRAPYQVDERRVPATGLKMRCPKCGTTFKVEVPTAGATSAPSSRGKTPAPVAGGFQPVAGSSSKRSKLSRTMIGVSSDLTAKPPQKKAGGFTMPRPGAELSTGPAPGAEEPADPIAEEEDVPAVLSGAFAPPSSAKGPPSEGVPESLVEPSSPLSLSELPAPVRGRKPSPSPETNKAETPPSAGALELEPDLPAAVPQVPQPPPRRPRPPAPPRRKVVAADASDLPSVPKPSGEPALELDLPSAVGEQTDPLEAELPALMSRSGNEGLDLDLPAVAGSVELDLDTAGDEVGTGLPVVSSATAVTRSDLPAATRSDLPAVASPGGAELPALVATEGAELPDVMGADLPSLGGRSGADLPDVSRAGLPAVGGADLPALGGADLPALGAPNLPSVSAQLPTASGKNRRDDFGSVDLLDDSLPSVQQVSLPEVHGSLPVVQASLPEVQGSLPEVQGSLPEVQGSLPEVQGSLPEVQGSLPEVQGSLPEVQGSLPDRRQGDDGFELDDFGEAGTEQDIDGIGDEFDLGQLERRRGGESPDDEFSFPPASDPFGSDEEDPFGGDGELETGAGAFGASDPPEVSRDPDGGYGELDIGTGDDNVSLETEDMEFSSIPQQDSNRPAGVAAATAQVHADPDVDAGASTLELERPRSKPSRARRVAFAASVALLVVAGGALSLDPRLGPFGFHFVMDQVKRPEYEKLLSTTNHRATELLGKDTLAEARQAVKFASALTERAPRFSPARAHAATVRYAVVLRFGPLPELEAAAKKLMSEIPADAQGTDISLARAAQLATTTPEQAVPALEALGSNPFALSMRAELALRGGKPEQAKEIFQSLAQQGTTAASSFGVARAELALRNIEAARAALRQVEALNPEHIGAVVVALDAHRASRHEDSAATAKLEEKSKQRSKEPVDGGTTQRLMEAVKRVLPAAAPSEVAYAHTVLGELEVEYGRNAPAQESFEKALAIDRAAPRALMGLGEVLYSSGRHSEALARFRAAAEARPKSLVASMGLIKCQIELGHTPEAQQSLKTLLEAHPDNADLVFWSARSHEAMDQNDAALIAYRKAIDAGKGRVDSVKAYLALANLQSRLEQLSQAKKTLREAQEKLPPSAELFLTLGRLDMSDGSYESALQHFKAALALDTADTRAHFAVGTAYARLRRFDQALERFEQVAKTDRDYPGLALERGRVYEVSGRNDQALAEYEAALSKAPDDQEMQLRVACSRVVAGKAQEAMSLLEPLVDARPRSAEVQHCMGRALFEEGKYVVASRHLERATSLDGQHAIYHMYVGWSALKLGRSSDAESALRRAIELDSGLGDAYWLLGSLRRKQGAVQDAVDYLKLGLELNPRRVEALSDLAMAYAELNEPSQAAATWARAVEAKPDEPTWRFRYAKLLSTQGRLKEGIPHLREALELERATRSADVSATGKVAAWVAQAHYLLGRALKGSQESVQHWQAYLRLSDRSHPYRAEAMNALAAMGQPWKPRP